MECDERIQGKNVGQEINYKLCALLGSMYTLVWEIFIWGYFIVKLWKFVWLTKY